MGLDMFLCGHKSLAFSETPREEDGYPIFSIRLELGYWRKHPNLHGYIVQAFGGGKDECQEIPLTVSDLKQITQAIKDQTLPHTEGFLFGVSSKSPEQMAEDLKILEGALAWLKAKTNDECRTICYQASW